METTRKILSFHKEDRSSDPNNPQSILLDFISSCQNLRIWSLNLSTREYLNNEQLQKGKQIEEWRQVSKDPTILGVRILCGNRSAVKNLLQRSRTPILQWSYTYMHVCISWTLHISVARQNINCFFFM
ncbi:unnamed protein product [Ilex paraguariensis]|uniref:Uncharacterized protein n=1 Tax=Ilex paraguariensis TaxID=185542 RepID=A0ABC8TS32_9AQUA